VPGHEPAPSKDLEAEIDGDRVVEEFAEAALNST
jgi:hypothetical protein